MCSKRKNSFFRTVTFRIVLWYAALFAASSLAVFLLVYFMLASSLRHRVDKALLSDAEEYEAIYNARDVDALQTDFDIEAKSEGLERVFFRLLSPRLDVLAASDLSRWSGLDAYPPPAMSSADGEVEYKSLTLPNHRDGVRVIYKKTGDGNILEVGYSLKDDNRLMQRYRETFGTVIAVLVICGVIAAWLLARRAMSGVERVTHTATRIEGGDLSLRVPLGNEGEEIDNLAKAFNNMLERIQVLVSELKEMINNIAHDLRSPITRIRGIAETTLTGEQRVDEYQDMAAMVVEESDRLVGMINTMLEIAETESGIADLPKNPVNMVEVINEAYELFQPVAEDEGIRLEVDTPSEDLIIPGDVARLQRVMANLLDNAIKYTPAGGKVLVSAKGNKSNVLILITDSGIGIPEEDLPHIFERFYRQDQSRSTPGSGLGLPLARTFVRAHGGDITVTSSPGKGSTFTVLLPRASLP